MESPPTPVTENGVKKTPDRTKSASTKKKSTTPVTVPKPFNLGLNKRVEDRQQYKEDLEQRHKEAEAREKVHKDEQEEIDKRELKEYRKSLVFKANPIRKYRDITINPSDKELTCPMAPALSTARRRRTGSIEREGSSDDMMSPFRQPSSSQSPTAAISEPATA